MRTIEFYDHDGTKLKVQMSSLASQEAFRIYLEGEQAPPYKDGQDRDIPIAIHLTRNQAEILIHALKDLFSDDE